MKGKEGATDFIGPDITSRSAAGNLDYLLICVPEIEAYGHEPWWGKRESCMLRSYTVGSVMTAKPTPCV